MKRGLLRAALLAVAATAAVIGASCTKKTAPTLYLPAGGTAISITMDFPVDVNGLKQSYDAVCGDAHAFLISFGTGTSTLPVWNYRFLTTTSGELWGCVNASAPCPVQEIDGLLPAPTRIAIEGIDLSPSAYAVSSTSNVICRGVADVISGMGEIDTATIPTPTPQATAPPSQLTLTVSATIPMLRVGDVNPTYSTAGPYELDGGIASLPGAARETSGGQILIVGGNSTSSFLFRPWTIATVKDVAKLAAARSRFFASGFIDSSGKPAVMIGAGVAASEEKTVEVLRPGIPGSTVFSPYNLTTFASSVPLWLPAHREGGVVTPAIFFVGGCYYNGTSEAFNARQEYFYPSAPLDLATCPPGALTGSPAMCGSVANAMGETGHCVMPVGVTSIGGTPNIFIGFGYATAFGNISNHAYLFDPEAKTFQGPLPSRGAPPALGRSGVLMSDGQIAFFGGFDGGGNSTKKWGMFNPSDLAVIEGGGTLRFSRTSHVQEGLPDGSIFIAGGTNGPPDARIVEIFRPASGTTSGNFTFVNRSESAAACVTGSEPNCVRLSISRIQGLSASIRGSNTWLNGSVVIAAGGADPSMHNVEIYVPSYACSGSTPVSLRGNPLSEVDFCDRGRARQTITDPANPSPF